MQRVPEDYMQRAPSQVSSSSSGLLGTGDPSTAVAHQEPAGMQRCQPRVMSSPTSPKLSPNLFILGEPVLHRYYTVYDWTSKQVGFGLANSHRNRLSNGDATSATTDLKVEAIDAL